MVDPRLEGIKYKIAALMEGDDLSIVFSEIKRKLAQDIINTKPDEVSIRNEKYWLVNSIKTLEKEFQGYVNDISRMEEDK